MNKYEYTLLGFIKVATQTDGSAAGYAMPNDIPQITLDDIMGVTEDDMKKHYKSTMADNVQSIRDRFMTAAAGKNIDLGPDEEAKFQNWYNWASNSPDYETKVHQPLTKIKPTGSAALAAGGASSPGQPNRVGYWGANPNLAARQALLQAAGPGTQGIDSQIKAESSRFNPGIPMDAPITRADLRRVDKQMMDKYKSLTGAGNPNSDMDRWKTLMAARHGKKWNMYSNDEFKKWRRGLNKTAPSQAVVPAPSPVVTPRYGDGSLLMMKGRIPQRPRAFASGFRPQFNILGGGM